MMDNVELADKFIDEFFPDGTPDSFDSNLDLIAEMMTQFADRVSNKWISVNDRLPENNEQVLIYSIPLEIESGRKLAPMACYFFDKFKSYYDSDHQRFIDSTEITHWQPLPEPPTQ